MIRQWIPPSPDITSTLLALTDAEASTLNSLFRPAWRAEPMPCISDADMLRDYPTHQWREAT